MGFFLLLPSVLGHRSSLWMPRWPLIGTSGHLPPFVTTADTCQCSQASRGMHEAGPSAVKHVSSIIIHIVGHRVMRESLKTCNHIADS